MGTATLASEFNSLTAWWRDAGVSDWAGEGAVRWLSDEASRQDVRAAAPLPPASTALPVEHAAFVEWLMSHDEFARTGPRARRLAPQGAPGSDVMILVDMPELGDVDAGRLFSGELGTQVEAMFAGIKLDRGALYLATLLPGRETTGRIAGDALPRLAEIARHHVRLVAPKKLWLMGDAASRALLGMSAGAAGKQVHDLEFDGLTVRSIATIHPRALLNDPERQHRKRMWPVMKQLFLGDTA